MNKDNGGPAFPTPRLEMNDEGVVTAFAVMADGMTLRDYFAAKAMQGFCAGGSTNTQDIAKAAYIVADAMLKARQQ